MLLNIQSRKNQKSNLSWQIFYRFWRLIWISFCINEKSNDVLATCFHDKSFWDFARFYYFYTFQIHWNCCLKFFNFRIVAVSDISYSSFNIQIFLIESFRNFYIFVFFNLPREHFHETLNHIFFELNTYGSVYRFDRNSLVSITTNDCIISKVIWFPFNFSSHNIITRCKIHLHTTIICTFIHWTDIL